MYNSNIKAKNINLKILSPVHIASGDSSKFSKLDYFLSKDKKKIHILDLTKFVMYLEEKNLLKFYTSTLEQKSLQNHRNDFDNDFMLQRLHLKEDQIKAITKYTLPANKILNKKKKTLNDLNFFVRNGFDNPYIPGSSLKGAFRTALFMYIIRMNYDDFKKYKTRLDQVRPGTNKDTQLEAIATDLEQDILNKYMHELKINNKLPYNQKPPIGISFSDSEEIDVSNMAVYQDIDYNILKERESLMPNFREYIKVDTDVSTQLKLDLKFASKFGINDFKDLKEVLKMQYEVLFSKNGVYFDIEDILDYIPKEEDIKSSLIIGGNVGYHQKSLLAALCKDKNELLAHSKFILHKSYKNAMSNHQNDKKYSPRVLNMIKSKGKNHICGFVKLEL